MALAEPSTRPSTRRQVYKLDLSTRTKHRNFVTKFSSHITDLIMARKMVLLSNIVFCRSTENVRKRNVKINHELDMLRGCTSPFIVHFIGAFRSDTQLSICMEYMAGGSFDQVLRRLGRIPESVVGKIALSVIKAVMYLEAKDILHRDIKPSNVLLGERGVIKLADLGVSTGLGLSAAAASRGQGSRLYMSPELLDRTHRCTVKSDVWSLGVTLVELALGQYPIPAPPSIAELCRLMDAEPKSEANSRALDVYALHRHIVNEPPPTLPRGHFSFECCDFVDRCLKKDLHARFDIRLYMADAFLHRAETLCASDVARLLLLPLPEEWV